MGFWRFVLRPGWSGCGGGAGSTPALNRCKLHTIVTPTPPKLKRNTRSRVFISVFTMVLAHFQARPASGLPGPAQLPQRPPDVSKMSPRCLQDVSQMSPRCPSWVPPPGTPLHRVPFIIRLMTPSPGLGYGERSELCQRFAHSSTQLLG